jgi:hypothetical protein
VTIGHEYAAVLRHERIGRSVEDLRAIACNTRLAERHQDTSRRTDLEDLLPLAVFRLAVGHPDVVIRVDEQAVRVDEHAGAEARDEPARGIEFQKRRQVRSVTRGGAASFEDPDRLAVTIDVDAVDLADLAATGELSESFYLVRIREIV